MNGGADSYGRSLRRTVIQYEYPDAYSKGIDLAAMNQSHTDRLRGLSLFTAVMLYSLMAAQADIESVVARNERAVLIIEGFRNNGGTPVQSSGCVVHGDGLVLTTAHQVDGVAQLEGRFLDGLRVGLHVVEIDRERELALLRADGKLPDTSVLGDAADLRSGARLIAIATPENLDFSVTVGIVANIDRTYRGHPVIQAEIAAAPGSSGAPVFNSRGEVVGLIMGALEEQEWATVIIPVNNAYPLLRRHGVLEPDPVTFEEKGELELLPAPNISDTELRALNAYNEGVRARDLHEKVGKYRLAAALLPGFYEAWFNFAVAASAERDYTAAIEAYRKALALRPERIETYRNLGRLYLSLDAYESAVEVFEKAAIIAPGMPQTHNDLGEAYRKAGMYEDAVDAFSQAVVLDSAYANAYYNLAITHMQTEQWALAGTAFRQYLDLAPDAADRGRVTKLIEEMAARAQP